MYPLKRINCIWSSSFAYAIGLFTADGCLSSDGRHLEFCSKDKEQVLNFKKCFRLNNKISRKARGKEKIKKYYRIQFGDVQFYNFLKSIGLSPAKSKILQKVKIPQEFFPDFLRGLFDGDGCFRAYSHPESQYPQLRIRFASASTKFIRWLRRGIKEKLQIKGFIENAIRVENLIYAKKDSLKLLNYIYYLPNIICLSRKLKKIKPYLKRT